MAYSIVRSDGRVLTTISDGTINTTSTSLGLPGKNYSSWGAIYDTNFVKITENFASNTPPANPLRGQLWFNTNNNTLCVCPSDGQANAAAWISLTSTSNVGSTTFGNVTAIGNISANNVSANNSMTANTISSGYLSVTANTSLANANISSATIASIVTPNISAGGNTSAGSLTGVWTINGSVGGAGASSLILNTGGISISNSSGANLYGIKCDNYMYANGQPVPLGITYSNSNVSAYLPTYTGRVGNVTANASAQFFGNLLSTGSNVNIGTITGNWQLSAGSTLQTIHADLAERYEADDEYPVGTVVKVGGNNEITAATNNDTDSVLGVVSTGYAYLMNAGAGDDKTHPAIALVGRVPIRCVGPISKGDQLIPVGTGCAKTSADGTGFGWALEDNTDSGEKLVMSVIK